MIHQYSLLILVRKYFALILILTFAAFLLSSNINKPFIGHHDWNGAWYSNQARNFIKYGYLKTKFGAVMNNDIVSAQDFRFFTHYPPLLPIFISLSFKIFGISESAARVIPLIFTLGTILLMYIISLKFFNRRIAILSSLLTTIFPITIYFGKMPVQEVIVIAPILLSVLRYFIFFEKPSRKNLLILFLSLTFSHLINWPGYYVTPLFFIHFLIFSKTSHKFTQATSFILFSVLMFFFHLSHTFLLTGELFGGGILDVALYRLNLKESLVDFTLQNFLTLQARWLAVYFTTSALFFSLVTVIWIFLKIKSKAISKKIQLLILLGVFGFTHNAVFRNMAFIHDYMIIYLLPFVAISSSFGFFLLIDKLKIYSAKPILMLASLFLILVTVERHKFTLALLSSARASDIYVLSNYIKNNTESGEKTLILSNIIKEHFEVFVYFYTDRQIDFETPQSNVELSKILSLYKYKLIVADPARDTHPSVVNYLKENRTETSVDKFLIYKNVQ